MRLLRILLLASYACFIIPVWGKDRPNILWITCEDMSPHLAAYGDATVNTPNIDRLAKEGIVYTHAFTTAGVCAPSRNAIITGRLQTTTGGHNMRTMGSTYPEITGLPAAYASVPPPGVRCFPEYLRARGYYCTNNSKTDYQFTAPPTVWDDNSGTAHWRNRKTGQPFFAVFNSIITHESQIWARKDHPQRVEPAKVPLPPLYPDDPIVRKDLARHYSNISEMDDWVGEILAQLEADGLLDKTIIFFFSDHGDGLPWYKRELYDRGLRIPLIIRFPDGRRAGTYADRLVSAIDLAPTVLSLAGIQAPDFMQGRAIWGKYAREAAPYIFAARDRMDSEYDRVRAVRDKQFKYIRNYMPEKPNYQNIAYRLQQDIMREILRRRDAGLLNEVQMRWFAPSKPEEELYDTERDPFELNNLAADPRYADVRARMREAHENFYKKYPDMGEIEEKALVRQFWNGQDTAQTTQAPLVRRNKPGKIQVLCATKGASIAYRERGENTWKVYTQPLDLPKGKSIEVMAMRIGYLPSEIVNFTP